MKVICGCLILFFVAMSGTPAAAAACPETYDFVDLGVMDDRLQLSHGGVVIKVKQPLGALLADGPHDCIPYIGALQPRMDSQGNPMPLMSQIRLSGTSVSKGITMLEVSGSQPPSNIELMTQVAAIAHLNAVDSGQFDVTYGDNFVCASIGVPFEGNITCEILSLSLENTPAVASCSATSCVLPVVTDENLLVTVRWDASGESLASPFARGAWIEEIARSTVNLVTSSIAKPKD